MPGFPFEEIQRDKGHCLGIDFIGEEGDTEVNILDEEVKYCSFSVKKFCNTALSVNCKQPNACGTRVSDSGGLRWGLKVSVTIEFPGNASVAQNPHFENHASQSWPHVRITCRDFYGIVKIFHSFIEI